MFSENRVDFSVRKLENLLQVFLQFLVEIKKMVALKVGEELCSEQFIRVLVNVVRVYFPVKKFLIEFRKIRKL